MAKKKKRMSKEELRAPDAFEQSVEKAWKKVAPHKTKLMMVIGLALVAGIGWTVYSGMQASGAAEKADAMFAAMHPLTAAIWDQEKDGNPAADGTIPTKPTGKTFKTAELARAAAIAGMDKYMADNGSSEGANAIALGVAGLKGDKDPKAAAAELDKWIGANASLGVTSAVRMLAGRAQLAAGDRTKARAHFDAVAQNQTGWLKAMALASLGDLDHPLMQAKGVAGNAAEAKKNYGEAAKLIGTKDESNAVDLKRELETKLASLP